MLILNSLLSPSFTSVDNDTAVTGEAALLMIGRVLYSLSSECDALAAFPKPLARETEKQPPSKLSKYSVRFGLASFVRSQTSQVIILTLNESLSCHCVCEGGLEHNTMTVDWTSAKNSRVTSSNVTMLSEQEHFKALYITGY